MTTIWTDKIIDLWTSEKIKLSQPATVDEIRVVEEALDFQFPFDFKELYLKVDGFIDWDWTRNMFSIWPLMKILEEYQKESDKNFIVFADYLINSHHIGFIKGENGVFKNYGAIPEFIAETFSEAIVLINSDADILY